MAFEYTGTAMMVVESDTTISMANHRLDEVTGFPQEEGDSKHQWTEFVSPADYNRLMEYHRRRRENSSEVPTEYEFRLRHRSGNYKDILMNVSMIPGTDKSLISLIDITRLKEMERAVRKSERKYRDLIENANDIIYTHDLEGRFLSVNAAGARIYGYTEAEILEIGIEDIVDPGFLSEAKQRIAEKLKGRKLTEAYELLTRTKTGQPVWVELSTRLYYEDGKPVHIQGIARDITDRRRAEDQLQESERRFREIAELLPGIICETDLEMRLKYVNPRGLETFGLTAADIERGVNVLEFIHPDYYAKMETDIRNIFSGDFGVPQEYRMVNRQGEDKWILINSAPLMRNGEIAGIRSSLIDSTELKRAREARRESERLFRSVFRHSPIGIVLFADDGAIREANEAFWQLVKDDPAAPASGESVFKMLDMPPVRYRQLRTGRGLEHESRWGDGETARYFAWHVTPLAGETRDDCLYLAQVEDITERKRIEEETLARARDSAREAMKLAEGLKKQIVQISTFQNMVSRSPAMKAIFDLLPEMARTAATVLITGESGTGKELIARSLHKLGSRRKKPFIAINCSALPDNLLESELFGYKAGAFTDAKKDKPGKFVMAQGGVLFLDEIGDISPAMQAKLLRVLQEKTVEPLGDTRSMPVDVRVIAATNKDLRAMADSGEFREDLLYRLKVLTIELPPLRQRRGDIPLLCDHFIRQFNTQYNKHIKSVSREALDTLLKHEFPGNVRELVNVLEHAFIFCKEESIQRGHLPREFHAAANEIAIGGEKTPVSSMHDLERAYIANLLEQCNGNKTEAARRMGVHKSTLFRRLKSLGLVDG
jgi:PAS domain S-box-containing protein